MKPVLIIALAFALLVPLMGVVFIYEQESEVEQKIIVQDDSSNLEKNSTVENNDEWKGVVFPELYDEDGKKLEKNEQDIETVSDFPISVDEDSIKVYVKEIPEFVPKSITTQVVFDAFTAWEELNPALEFEVINQVGDQPRWFYRQNSDIQIKWVTNISQVEHMMGQSETTITEYGDGTKTIQHEILIDVADVDCKGNPIFWNKNTITDTVKHELGHALGLEHSSDINNLMFGYDGKYNFDTKGYIIPEILGDEMYIGQRYVDEDCFINSSSKYDPYG